MGSQELDLTGGTREFPLTSWTLVQSATPVGRKRSIEVLEALCRVYWKPVYWHVRRSWAKSDEDAKDLAQAFFARVLEGDLFELADRERGSFRNYLRGALENFLRKEQRKEQTLKRGGHLRRVAEGELASLPAESDDFDALWARSVLEEAVATLEERLKVEGKLEFFRAFELLLLGDRELTIAEAARLESTSESTLRRRFDYARRALQGIVHARLRETLQGAEDLDAEILALFHGSFGG